MRSVVPTFLVSDVGTTARWYAERLGFRIVGTFPEAEPWGYASVMLGPAELMLLRLDGYEKPDLAARRGAAGVWDAYVRLDGVHAFHERVRARGVVTVPLRKQPYGDWEFEVRDPNGYVLVFGGDAALPDPAAGSPG
ncbi:MAG TPA: VOC family protein [Gemmatimonadaceae bacterium]|nr:VOC family protein [Gemmatimonadaceae bacterium]